MADLKNDADVIHELDKVMPGYRTNIVQGRSDKHKYVEIREFSERMAAMGTGNPYHGWTKKGLRFTKEEAQKAIEVLQKALSYL